MAVGSAGNLFIADTENNRIRKVTTAGMIGTVAGSGVLPTAVDQDWKLVGIADFNVDGSPDLLWRNSSTGENYVWHMNGISCIGGEALPTVPDQSWTVTPQGY